MLKINSQKETEKIIEFIKAILKREGFGKVVIGLSGGIDSTTSFYLLKRVLDSKNIIVAYLYYSKTKDKDLENVLKEAKIPARNIYRLSIKEVADKAISLLKIDPAVNQIRAGNIMVRVRMTILFDLAKKHQALVCGTENKSEYLLGYFTRFGDEASDFEPIKHLFKTQVYQLAQHLGIPKSIIDRKPTAGLWLGQTDEEELGFSYQEADPILYLYFEKKLKVSEIKKRGFKNAGKVIDCALKNKFKHQTPYTF